MLKKSLATINLVITMLIHGMDTEHTISSQQETESARFICREREDFGHFFTTHKVFFSMKSALCEEERSLYEGLLTSLPNIASQFSKTENISCVVQDPLKAYILVGFNNGDVAFQGLGDYTHFHHRYKAPSQCALPVTALAPYHTPFNSNVYTNPSLDIMAGYQNGSYLVYKNHKRGYSVNGADMDVKSPIIAIAHGPIPDVFLFATSTAICLEKAHLTAKNIYKIVEIPKNNSAIVAIGIASGSIIAQTSNGNFHIISPCLSNLNTLCAARQQEKLLAHQRIEDALGSLAISDQSSEDDEEESE